jgi:hypothetical protein
MIVGDSVVIWRTWAIYEHRILAILMPCVLALVSFGERLEFAFKLSGVTHCLIYSLCDHRHYLQYT